MSKITIADVAREAGVSKPTVSRVMNGKGETSQETVRRVQAAIVKLGYRPNSVARSLTTRRTLSLGLIVPDLSNPYFAEIAEGAEMAAWEKGYSMFLCNIFGNLDHEEAALRSFEDRGVDGVIICSTRLPEERLLSLLERQRAAVLINRSTSSTAGTIKIDDIWGATLAVKHLHSRGRHKTGLIAGPRAWPSSQERTKGFLSAMREAGQEVDKDLVVSCPLKVEGAEEAAGALLLRSPQLDSLICFNDVVAVGALRACAKLGKGVPEEIAIIGHDDIPVAGLVTPALTTLRVNKHEIGRNAVRMLLDRMQGQNRQMNILVKPELVVRESAP